MVHSTALSSNNHGLSYQRKQKPSFLPRAFFTLLLKPYTQQAKQLEHTQRSHPAPLACQLTAAPAPQAVKEAAGAHRHAPHRPLAAAATKDGASPLHRRPARPAQGAGPAAQVQGAAQAQQGRPHPLLRQPLQQGASCCCWLGCAPRQHHCIPQRFPKHSLCVSLP